MDLQRNVRGCEELIPFFSTDMADYSSKNNMRVSLRLVIDNQIGLGYTSKYHIVVYSNLRYFPKNPLLQEEGRILVIFKGRPSC